MTRHEFQKSLQRYIVNVGISGSSLRNQGAKDVVGRARDFLADLDLTPLRIIDPADYPAWLERTTGDLLNQLPDGAKKWGAARKAINILTTQAFLNGTLAEEFKLSRLGNAMETPLDSVAAKGLRKSPGGKSLPRWKGVGGLTLEVSRAYQDFALNVARDKDIPRACLDVFLWRPLADSATRLSPV